MQCFSLIACLQKFLKKISLGIFIKPDYRFLRSFGCLCFPWLRPYNKNKLEFCSRPCVFLGYSTNHLGYRCMDIDTGYVFLSRHVVFNEKVFPFQNSHLVSQPSTATSKSLEPMLLLRQTLAPTGPYYSMMYGTTITSSTTPVPTSLQTSGPTSQHHGSPNSNIACHTHCTTTRLYSSCHNATCCRFISTTNYCSSATWRYCYSNILIVTRPAWPSLGEHLTSSNGEDCPTILYKLAPLHGDIVHSIDVINTMPTDPLGA